MSDFAIQTAVPFESLPDMPLDAAQITVGSPVARGAILTQSADKRVSSGYWSCTEGEFDWTFAWDEFVHVLEGRVTMTPEGGQGRMFQAGDTAHFPLGLKTHWHVDQPVKKFFVVRTPDPLEL